VKAVPMPVDVSVPSLPTEQLLVCKGNDVLVGDDRLAGEAPSAVIHSAREAVQMFYVQQPVLVPWKQTTNAN
jgi:hypothetical protein